MRLNTNVLRVATNAQEKKNKKDFFLIVTDNKNHARANEMEKKKNKYLSMLVYSVYPYSSMSCEWQRI